MRRFVEGTDRGQSTLFPECLEDWIGEDNPVRVIDVFVDELDLAEAEQTRQRVFLRFKDLFERVDVLLTPAAPLILSIAKLVQQGNPIGWPPHA